MQEQLSKQMQQALDKYKEFRLRRHQYWNLKRITDSPLPKKKAKRFEILMIDYHMRFFNAKQAMEATFRKLTPMQRNEVLAAAAKQRLQLGRKVGELAVAQQVSVEART